MALSDVLRCLFLGESLKKHAIKGFILENKLNSSQGNAKSVKNAVSGKFEQTSKPHSDRRPDPLGNFSLLGLKVQSKVLKKEGQLN